MNNDKILKGIQKVHYGAFGGITPFPICLKSVSDYLGDELDYTFAIVACGGAFRFAWNTTELDGGNVDISHTYSDSELPFRYGITALGRDFKMLWREGNGMNKPGNGTKDDFKVFIKKHIDNGKPLISLGPVGPPEAGIITGYRDGGETLFGWSLFQWDEKTFNEDGYFTDDKWWEASDFFGIMALGDINTPRIGTKQIVQNAISALEGRQEGKHAKGIAAYEPWKNALLNAKESDFAIMPDWGQSLIMMCQGDATDALIDGRKNACKYFTGLADENSNQPLYVQIAEQFGFIAKVIHENIYAILGGYERGSEQNKKLEQLETRNKICEYIDKMKAADEKALDLMKKLLAESE
jgi:hypothetical protein